MSKVNIPFNRNFFENYISEVPIALAMERSLECKVLSGNDFLRPVLDLGCGEGLFAKVLFSEKIDYGVDPNKRELKRAAKLEVYTELICCFGDSIPIDDSSIATIFSNSVLEHIKDLRPVLIESNRLLVKGGRMYVTVPTESFDKNSFIGRVLNRLALNAAQQKYLEFYNWFWNHFHYYSISDWISLFQETGFKVSKIQTYNSPSLTTFNDVLAPWGSLAYFKKLITNKWIFFPNFRRILYSKLCGSVDSVLENNINVDNGTLVFFQLEK